MTKKLSPRQKRRATYTTLTGIFVTIFASFSMFSSRKRKRTEIKPFEFVQLSLATLRLGRLISYDEVFEPYRAPFTRTVQDPTGEGLTVVSKGNGARAAIGDLVACPICTGTWVAAFLVYGMNLFPRATRSFIAIMSAVGAAELLNAATEMLQWNGQLARERAGNERSRSLGESNPRESISGPRFPGHANPDLPRRRFEDREWKRPQQPV